MSVSSREGKDQEALGSSAAGYLVLARRYRPTQFADVIGQIHVTRTLENAIHADRVHHAYLFTGSRGVGKTTVARILAKALSCERGPTATPCDQCDSCREIRDGRAVDIYEIDGASHTGVDDVRELRESVRYLPTRMRHKIYIIDEVHMLSTSAFNALLKTLEEPPRHVVFVFATTEPHKIPATILSRCQRFDFKRVDTRTLTAHLASLCEKEGVQVELEGLTLCARAAEGSVRDSLSLLDQIIAYAATEQPITAAKVAEVLGVTDRRVLFELSAAILGRDAETALGIIDRLFQSGQDLSQFAQAFLAHLRDLAIARTVKQLDAYVEGTDAELAELAAQARGDKSALVDQLFSQFARTAEAVARSPHPRLMLEMAMIEMAMIEPVLPLGDLLERLEALESRLRGGAATVGSAGAGRGGGGGAGGGQPRPSSTQGRAPAARREQSGKMPWERPFPPSRTTAPAAAPKAALAGAGSAEQSSPLGHDPGARVKRGERERDPESSTVAVAPTPLPATAPEPARAPLLSLSADASFAATMRQWQRLLAAVMEEEPVAASAFAAGRLLSFEADTIVLGYPQGSFEHSWAQDAKRRDAFATQCSKHAGRPLRVAIRELSAAEQASEAVGALSAFADEEQRQRTRARELKDEAKRHPITRGLVELFGASIDSISTEIER